MERFEGYREFDEKEVSKKDVRKFILGAMLLFYSKVWYDFKRYAHFVTDFLFQRYVWYRKRRDCVCVRIMFRCSGDMRNHVSPRWKATKCGDLHDFYMKKMDKLQEKYFILDVHHKRREFDMVKDLRVDKDEYKRYKRFDTIDELLA